MIMGPIPVLRGPLLRPRSTVQVWVWQYGRGTEPANGLNGPRTQRSPAHSHSATSQTHRDPVHLAAQVRLPQIGFAATAGPSMNPHLRVEVPWVPAELPPARFACERHRDDGVVAGLRAALTHKDVRISDQPESES